MKVGVGVVGAGLIGSRRAEVAAAHHSSRLVMIADLDEDRATGLASRFGCAATTDWQRLVANPEVGVVVVSTFNKALAPVAIAAAEQGKHVLCEKPLGRNSSEAAQIVEACARAGVALKAGFNLRFHPGIRAAHSLVTSGQLGEPLVARAVYGHGGRPGYEREWRADADLAGGGELLDQGVHVVDLCRWFLGEFTEVSGMTSRGVWPIGDLEDNAFAMMRSRGGAVAMFHTSWTQWRNRFLFEVLTSGGAVTVEGLGGSYGAERLTVAHRNPAGGRPDEETTTYPEIDTSWRDEWEEFLQALRQDREPLSGGADALNTMRLIAAIYQAAADRTLVRPGSEESTMKDALEVRGQAPGRSR